MGSSLAIPKLVVDSLTSCHHRHHLHRLSLLHRFLTGGSTSLASSPPSAALDYPTLTSTTSIQVASYAFTAFLEQLLQSGEGNGKQNSALAAKLRKWAPLPPALSAEVRKGNAIGTRVQYEYIILTRLILVVRAAPFVQPLSEEEGAAAVKDAEELLIAVGGLVEDGAGVGGLVCFAAFVAVVSSSLICATLADCFDRWSRPLPSYSVTRILFRRQPRPPSCALTSSSPLPRSRTTLSRLRLSLS